ncbi:MAG: hypothetical protein QOH99_168 [Frankiaceae bacterium]|nr:hypothetical protein [Frankiaceae bacterium]
MTTGPLSVTGGAGGIDASLDDMEATSRVLAAEAAELGRIALAGHRLLLSANLAASAVLDPGGAAASEAAILAALDGPHGVTGRAAGLELMSAGLWAAAATYRATDDALAASDLARHWVTGYAAVCAAPIVLVAVGAAFVAAPALTGAAAAELSNVDWGRFIANHPGLVDEASADAPGGVSALMSPLQPLSGAFAFSQGQSPVPMTVAQAAGLVGLAYPDGHGEAIANPDATTTSTGTPRDLQDILRALATRNSMSAGTEQGDIDVRIVTTVDASGIAHKSYIVDIPGTKDWQFDPSGDRTQPNDVGTNVHGLGGDDTARREGVLQALRIAGAGPADPVMLVGHSQGGLVAMSTALAASESGEFRITNVITAGAPIGGMPVPRGTQVLSLENRADIVPRLDGQANADIDNRVTVTFDDQHHNIGENHSMTTTYLPASAQVDSSADPSVRAFLAGLHGTFLVASGTVTTNVYTIRRTG